MTEINELMPEDVEKMDYNQIIGLVRETNHPPGGKNTVFEILNRCLINESNEVLEIGTSTGFTALEISRLVKCKLTSIDINEQSLNEAKSRAKQEGFDNINFKIADVGQLPFEDKKFDLVIVGNVFSIVNNKEKAFEECRRVCKKQGFIAAMPMYYTETPSNELIKNVSQAIQVDISPQYKADWVEFFKIPNIEMYWSKDFKFDYMNDEIIKKFVEDILSRKHLKDLKTETYSKLVEVYNDFMFLFRDNLSKMGFTICLLSNTKTWEDPELYTSKAIEGS